MMRTVFLFALLQLTLAHAKEEQDVIRATMGSNGEEYTDFGYMPGHGSNSGRVIKVSSSGSGDYSTLSRQLVMSKDWFVNSTQVEEVRFVCASGKRALAEARVVFPTNAEYMAERGVRLEIPCEYKKEQTEEFMQRAQKLLNDRQNRSAAFVKNARILADHCDTDPYQLSCVQWRKKIEDLVSGEIMAPLGGPVRYCKLLIDAGLGKAIEVKKKVKDGSDLFSEIDMTANVTQSNAMQYHKWIQSQYPECIHRDKTQMACLAECAESSNKSYIETSTCLVSCNGMGMVPLNPKYSADRCLANIKKAVDSFAKLKPSVIVLPGATPLIKNLPCPKVAEGKITSPTPAACYLATEVTELLDTALRVGDPDRALTMDDMQNIAQLVAGDAKFEVIDGAQHYRGSSSGQLCGWDSACLQFVEKIKHEIWYQFELNKKGSEAGCFIIDRISVDTTGKPIVKIVPSTEECDAE